MDIDGDVRGPASPRGSAVDLLPPATRAGLAPFAYGRRPRASATADARRDDGREACHMIPCENCHTFLAAVQPRCHWKWNRAAVRGASERRRQLEWLNRRRQLLHKLCDEAAVAGTQAELQPGQRRSSGNVGQQGITLVDVCVK